MLVKLCNIQSIYEATYDIPEVGITQIIGENSNGKSILIKALSFIAKGLIKDKEERNDIINDNKESGSIFIEHNGTSLLVNIARERDNCYYELRRKDGTTIKRTIREGGLEYLTEELGFAVYSNNVCLQIFETFGIMPFVNNTASSDYEIIDSIISDKVANDFVFNYKNITFPKIKELVSTLKFKIESCDNVLSGVTFYNIDKYEDILYKLKKYKNILSFMKVIEPNPLPITKYFKYDNLKVFEPKLLPIIRVIPTFDLPSSLYQEVKDLSLALNGTCPTCGVRFSDLENHNH